MPELPEVETIAQELNEQVKTMGRIEKVSLFWPKMIRSSQKEFFSILEGKKIHSVSRKGKYLVFSLDDQWFLITHLRMSGRFLLKEESAPREKHEHVIFHFEKNLSLRFHDTRKFGTMDLLQNPHNFFSNLGMDPFDPLFTIESLTLLLSKKDQNLKAFLLDQKNLAGLGNIYVDESLFTAGLHPERKTSSLTKKEISLLFEAIKAVLLKGIQFRGTSLGEGRGNFHGVNGQTGLFQFHLFVYGQAGNVCKQCKTASIKKIVFAQRGTHFCPFCQKL